MVEPLSYLGLLCLSAATLAFEVVLTRLFALAQGHHFAFMAVSLALLGGGASGTFLALHPITPQAVARRLAISAGLFSLTTPTSYVLVNVLPFDAYRMALERIQLVWLTGYYLSLTLPFFFSGLAVGAALVAWPGQASRLYAANLVGSGLGPPLALQALASFGGPGAVFGVAALGCVAAALLGWTTVRPKWSPTARVLPIVLMLAFGWLCLRPPPWADMRLIPYQSLPQALLYPGSQIAWQEWNAFSRVDVVVSPGIRSAPGLSMAFPGSLPSQLGLTVDGQNLSPITPVSPDQAEFADYLPGALAYQLRPQADVLIIEPGGGLAALAALRGGARSVTAVYGNPTVAAAVRQWGDTPAADPRLNVVVDEPRSFLRRVGGRFDLVVVPLTDTFRPITAGAYALAEDYRYTTDAFAELWDHLTPRGLLVAERWLQLPPSESLRLWGITLNMLQRAGVADPGAQLLALRSMQTALIIAGRQPVSQDELRLVHAFVASRQYDLIWTPELSQVSPFAGDDELAYLGINRYNVIRDAPHFRTFARLLAAPDPARYYADYQYAVAPPTDNQPFFFHFFKWQQTPQVLAGLGHTWQPFGGSGYLVLVALLGLVLILSGGLILLPLMFGYRASGMRRQPPGAMPAHLHGVLLLYFSAVGLGFLLVEIPLLQQFIVYLGQPAYAFATVVSALLLASGVGSRYLSQRLPRRLALGALAGLTIIYPWMLPPLFRASFGLPLGGRMLVSVLALAPLGLLMGTPFPQGLAWIQRAAPGLLAWAWAVNGCASVVSAVLAAMLAIDLGFRAVMLLGAGAYLLALMTMWRAPSVQAPAG
jgi:hypothetical protein